MSAKLPPTPFPELNQVLLELVTRLQQILSMHMIGAYLQGSFAVGDFDQYSDVDFIVAIEQDLSSSQVESLQVMHDQIYQLESEWAKHLEGSYFPRDILRETARRGELLWYLDHGARSLIRSDHCNTILVRWVVREQGVILAGPAPKTLVNLISTEDLRAEMFATITDWGQQILNDPAHYENRFYQSFIVLSYCRMLHDLTRGYPGSKREGAEWAKTSLDPSWSDLIIRTWDGRPDPAQKIKQPPDPVDFERTLRFVAYVMEQSRQYMTGRKTNNPI